MTIPASKLIRYIETADSWPLRDESGTLRRRIERDEFRLIAQSGRDDVVFAVGTATRIKFLKLSVPEAIFHSAIAESATIRHEQQRERNRGRRLPMEPPYVERVSTGNHSVWQHNAARCSSVRPDLERVCVV